ncbi:MAG TPA: adenylate/guanylate cyclase domain-containing protein, partial [Mycobacterium sp.]
MTAALACGACGAEPRLGARFCDCCGTAIRASAQHAEYKQVTMLFADVVRSMDIASAVGAERLREIMAELLDRSTAVIQRYGGTVDRFTGDGIMAIFGAPIALEDHAYRACLASLDVQRATARLATEIEQRDGITLQLRIGLNSGQVIAGEVGSSPMGYTAIGEQVGMAQRMESAAPAGGVMLSESTAGLVGHLAVLADTENVHIKGLDEPVPAQRLLSMAESGRTRRQDPRLVGRTWELNALTGILDESITGAGSVVGVVGSPGIGKSRIVREVAAIATGRGVDVFTTHCESHTAEIPFHVISRLLRATYGVNDIDDAAGREEVRQRFDDADPADLILLDDLLGIRDSTTDLPDISPDARRRRLASLVKTTSLARPATGVYIIEDVHWIDEVSESILADLLTVVPQTPSMVLITYRPEYQGALGRSANAQTIALTPLNDSQASTLIAELLGPDGSVAALGSRIAQRAAGNPFFVQEIVRDLAERKVLEGDRGGYTCRSDVVDSDVPATLHATIAARIDRLDDAAKRTLSAAAVIGSRFDTGLVATLVGDDALPELVDAELVDQVMFSPRAEYAFHHPLIRTVAYESQLKSDRAESHRLLAAALEQRDPVEQNAALIAEHLEAAGDLHAAFGWHMRAGNWSVVRDSDAARMSWQRARDVADRLPAD